MAPSGRAVGNIAFWVPHPVSLSLGLSILSYAGQITVGVMADAGVIEGSSFLARAIKDAREALQSAVDGASEAMTQ